MLKLSQHFRRLLRSAQQGMTIIMLEIRARYELPPTLMKNDQMKSAISEDVCVVALLRVVPRMYGKEPNEHHEKPCNRTYGSTAHQCPSSNRKKEHFDNKTKRNGPACNIHSSNETGNKKKTKQSHKTRLFNPK